MPLPPPVLTRWIWVVLAIQLSASAVLDMGYATVFLLIIHTTPDPSRLGTINGLAQTVVSLARALGPAGATALFSLGVESGFGFGGKDGRGAYLVFVAYTLLAGAGIGVAAMLDGNAVERESEQESDALVVDSDLGE